MKVQRIILPKSGRVSFRVLDNAFSPIEEVSVYLRYMDKAGLSPNTVKNAAIHLAEYWRFLAGNSLSWRKPSLTTLAEFVEWLRSPAPGIVSIADYEPKRSNQTINGYLGSVSMFYQFHKSLEPEVFKQSFFGDKFIQGYRYKKFLHHIGRSKPVRSKLIKLPTEKKRPKTLSVNEVKEVLKACQSMRDKFLFGLLYHGGLRVGQALGLRHEDVVSMDNVVRIVPRYSNSNGARAKTHDTYEVHVPKEVMQIYTRYLLEELDGIESDYVFVNTKGGEIGRPMKYSAVYDKAKRIEKLTGVPIRPHMLRHSHVTELFRSGMRDDLIQRRVGHRSIQTTNNMYNHANQDDMKKAIRKFERTASKKNRKSN